MKLTRRFIYAAAFMMAFSIASAGPFDVKQPLPEQSVSIYKLQMTTKTTNEPIGSCTGWVAENKEGEIRIVTNSHCCIDNGTEVDPEIGDLTNIKLADGRALKRFIFDPLADICILSIEGDTSKEKPLHLAATPTNILEPVTVVGHPSGRPLEAYLGHRIDSALIPIGYFDVDVITMFGEADWCISVPATNMCMYLRQSDTYKIHIEPGNSGSPLLNKNGDVVGLIWGMMSFNDSSLAASLAQLKRYIK